MKSNKQIKQTLKSLKPSRHFCYKWEYLDPTAQSIIHSSRKDHVILGKLKKILSKEKYQHLIDFLKENTFTFNYSLLRLQSSEFYASKGLTVQRSDLVGEYYVYQVCSFEDCYHGVLWIPVTEQRCLRLEFNS